MQQMYHLSIKSFKQYTLPIQSLGKYQFYYYLLLFTMFNLFSLIYVLGFNNFYFLITIYSTFFYTDSLYIQANEPRLSFFDNDFYIRDQRTDNNQETNRDSTINLSDIFNAVAADHTYPRNPDLGRSSTQGDGLSPLMTSIHFTISHIQRQARVLRQQVESIER